MFRLQNIVPGKMENTVDALIAAFLLLILDFCQYFRALVEELLRTMEETGRKYTLFI